MKEFKTVNEQIKLLKSRNLTILDEEKAKEISCCMDIMK